MRIPSGKTDCYLYFVAVDSSDLKTRETGLSSFTVVRSRNGAADVTYTTPTVTEIDNTTMPGVYALLIDEDTTITSGADSEEVCVHITQASMAPVTRTFELYRRDTTSGRALAVDASGRALSDVDTIKTNPVVNGGTATFPTNATLASTTNITAGTVTTATNVTTVNGLAANVITAASMAADASAEIADAVWDEDATGHQTGGTFGQAIGDPGADTNTIFKAVVTDATGATVGVDVAAVLADTGTDGVVVASIAAGAITAAAIADGAIDAATFAAGAITASAIAADAIGASELAADAVAEIADAVWDEALAGHAGAGSAGEALSAAGTAGDPWTTALPGAYGAGTAGKIIGDNINATISSRASQASVDTIDGIVDDILVDTGTTLQGELDGIQADTEDIQSRLPAALTGDGNIKADMLRVGGTLQTAGDIPALVTTVDTVVDAVKAKTDSLTFTVANQVDSNVQYVNDVQVTGNGETGTEWGPA